MTDHRLLDLEKEGLLRPRTSLSRPEWIVPRGGPPGAETAYGVRGLFRQVSSPRPRLSPKPLYEGALPSLRGGALALFAKSHHYCGDFAVVC